MSPELFSNKPYNHKVLYVTYTISTTSLEEYCTAYGKNYLKDRRENGWVDIKVQRKQIHV